VLGHRYENTYCPECGELLIQRFGLRVAQNRLDGTRCPACQRLIPVVGRCHYCGTGTRQRV